MCKFVFPIQASPTPCLNRRLPAKVSFRGSIIIEPELNNPLEEISYEGAREERSEQVAVLAMTHLNMFFHHCL